jgi:glucose/arabinose dehydrogenase
MKKMIYFCLGVFISASSLAQTWQVGNTTLTESDLVTGLSLPWEILWGQDDMIWSTLRGGKVLRIDPNTGTYTQVLDKSSVIPYSGGSEPGMLGMCMHPDFPTTPLVYIVYNYTQGNSIKERLVSFEWNGTALVNETTLIDAIGGNSIHNGSRIIITPDNKILMTTGDKGDQGVSSQNITSLNGKTLRVNLDGSIPSDNPDPSSYVWSFGHRNGQGLCVGPNGIIYESEHGQNNSDELNIIEPGRNYGWPTVEGACNTTAEINYCNTNNVKEPLLEWSPCRAVNGLEYYNHPAIPEWNNCILMAVLGGLNSSYERMTVIHLSADGLTATTADVSGSSTNSDAFFQSFNKRLRDLCVNPHDGSLYVALNGAQYPGSGPNIIKKFKNEAWVGVQSIETSENVMVYPNPTSNALNVQFSSNQMGGTFQIYSFTGSLVQEGLINATSMTIDVQNWEAGSYFIVSNATVGTTSKTFVVQ